MSLLQTLLASIELAAPLPAAQAEACATDLGHLAGLVIYPRSIAACRRTVYFLGRRGTEKLLGIVFSGAAPSGFLGNAQTVTPGGAPLTLLVGPTDHTNALALRTHLPFMAPQPIGLRKSVGCGDRLGLATPGHVRAVRRGTMAPIFAQQSIREMARTGHTPEQVLDDATWGVFQEGWRSGYGADADHLKTTDDIDRCVAAGFVLYTVDPGEYVDDAASADDLAALRPRLERLPWPELESSPEVLRRCYLRRAFDVGEFAITFDQDVLVRAAVKYGRAVAHTARMYRHLAARMAAEGRPFELEVSVDETATPTTPTEHTFVVSELKRMGVPLVSLAPRFVGRFEKGVDYIGDLRAFEADIRQHAAIARALGPYKLSLHSGSDKFSIYPIAVQASGDLVHLKTAGTSYLEALRAIAGSQPDLFREVLAFALARYEDDRRSYHVSADPARLPDPRRLAAGALASVLDSFDGRQVLHVTFGSVLTARDAGGGYRFRDRLLAALQADEEAHYAALERHFARHLAPFGSQESGAGHG
jgi:hypothetical protein